MALSALMAVGWALAYLVAFFYAYVLVMAAYRAHLAGGLSWPLKVMFGPALIAGYVMDVLAQYTFASAVFVDWPRRGEHLVTDRLQRYMREDYSWRRTRAQWLCEHLLDPLDPTGRHC